MMKLKDITTAARQASGLVLALALTGYFAVNAFSGEYSIKQLKALKAREARLMLLADTVAAERESLERHVGAMRGEKLDSDRLEEEVRRSLGYAHPDEIIVMLN